MLLPLSFDFIRMIFTLIFHGVLESLLTRECRRQISLQHGNFVSIPARQAVRSPSTNQF
eukprot:m.197114 g.197114  ORF g.197114 m.197114 type:complete len:59 (+) comp15274_c0_seq1:1924-2100(+)